jgi:putative oxidoreductase
LHNCVTFPLYLNNQLFNTMKSLINIRIWGENHPKWVDYLRIILGLILIWRGVSFLLNLDLLDLYLKESGLDDTLGLSISINFLAQLIVILNVFGGICIALNIYARMFSLFNLPVLIGAVFFVNMRQDAFRPHSQFWIPLLVLLCIISFLLLDNEALTEHNREKAAV